MATLQETTGETTLIITVSESEEILVIATENKGKSYSIALVCVHNVVPTVVLLLPSPIAAFINWNISALLENPLLILSEMDIMRTLANPSLETDIHELFTSNISSEVLFFMWNSSPILAHAIVLNLTVQNVNPSLSRLVANPNTYNESPTLNISVVKTP
jgi:hypothetical protein